MPRGKKGRTYEQVIDALNKSGRTDVTVLNNKKISHSGYQWLWQCTNPKCGHKWYAEYAQVLGIRGYGCDKCARIRYGKERRLTDEEIRTKVKSKRDDVDLVIYAGRTKDYSLWKCLKCGKTWHESYWHIMGDKKGIMAFCPHCHNHFKHRYNVDGAPLHSKPEAIFYVYHKTMGYDITRLCKEICFPYPCKGRVLKWYPDFFLKPHPDLIDRYPNIYETCGVIIEVKPENGGQEPIKSLAKRLSGWDVEWVGTKEIKQQNEKLIALGIDINQYRET